MDCLEVAGRGCRESSFDDVDTEPGESSSKAQLLATVHCEARCLLAIAQRGIEDDQLIQLRGSLIGRMVVCVHEVGRD